MIILQVGAVKNDDQKGAVLMALGDFSFKTRIRVRYSEVDAQGIVYNAHYLTYCDLGITEYMRNIGELFTSELRREEDVHVVRAELNWKASARVDELLELWVRVARIGRSSLRFAVEIHPADTDRLLVAGEIVWVNTNQQTHRAVPFPAQLVEKIRAVEGDRVVLAR